MSPYQVVASYVYAFCERLSILRLFERMANLNIATSSKLQVGSIGL